MPRSRAIVLVTLLALLALLALPAACSDDGDSPKQDSALAVDTSTSCSTATLLPAASAVGDFAQRAAPERASTLQELTALIDGGSEKYTQGGKFVCMTKVTYASSTKAHTLEVWLFDETDAAGATAAYLASKNPDDQDLSPVIGDAARGHENSIAGIYQADMRKGRYLARVIASKVAGKEDALSMLRAMATAIQ